MQAYKIGMDFFEKSEYLDASKKFLEAALEFKNSKRISEAANVYGLAANCFIEIGNKKEAFKYFKNALELAIEAGHKKGAGIYLNRIGYIQMKMGLIEESQITIERALLIFEELQNKEELSKNSILLGTILLKRCRQLSEKGELNEALKFNQQALVIFKELGDLDGQFASYQIAGEIHQKLGDLDAALNIYQLVMQISEKMGDKKQKSITLNQIGAIFIERGDIETAQKYINQSLEINEEIDDNNGKSIILINLGVASYNQGDYLTSLKYYQQAAHFTEDLQTKSMLLNNLGSILHQLDRLDESLAYFTKAAEIGSGIWNNENKSMNFNNIAGIFEDKGDYLSALSNYLKALSLLKVEIKGKELDYKGGKILCPNKNCMNELEIKFMGSRGATIQTCPTCQTQFSIWMIDEERSKFHVNILSEDEIEDRDDIQEDKIMLRQEAGKGTKTKIFKWLSKSAVVSSNVGNIYEKLNDLNEACDYYYQAAIIYRGLGLYEASEIEIKQINALLPSLDKDVQEKYNHEINSLKRKNSELLRSREFLHIIIFCPNCHFKNQIKASSTTVAIGFCSKCLAKFSVFYDDVAQEFYTNLLKAPEKKGVKFCYKCGKKVGLIAKFCLKCGNKIIRENQTIQTIRKQPDAPEKTNNFLNFNQDDIESMAKDIFKDAYKITEKDMLPEDAKLEKPLSRKEEMEQYNLKERMKNAEKEGNANYKKGEFTDALKSFNIALKHARELRDREKGREFKEKINSLLNLFAKTSKGVKRDKISIDESLIEEEKMIQHASKGKKLFEAGNKQEALIELTRALEIARFLDKIKEIEEYQELIKLLKVSSVVKKYEEETRLKHFQLNLSQEEVLKSASDIEKGFKNLEVDESLFILHNAAIYLIEQGSNNSQAGKYLNKMLEIAKELKFTLVFTSAIILWAVSDTQLGNFGSAKEFYNNASLLSKKINDSEKKSIITHNLKIVEDLVRNRKKYKTIQSDIKISEQIEDPKDEITKDFQSYQGVELINKEIEVLKKLEQYCGHPIPLTKGRFRTLDKSPVLGYVKDKNVYKLEFTIKWDKKDIPDVLHDLKKLQISSVRSQSLIHLPESIENIEILKLFSVKNEFLVANENLLNKLKKLYLHISRNKTFPDSINVFSNLTELTLSGVINRLPETFGNLNKLEKIMGNDIYLKELPESFGNLSSLRELIINNNRLSELPESFGNLSSLRELIINNNQLSELPESFGNLIKLEKCWIYSNRLRSLPESIGNLDSLRSLRVYSNQLTHLPNSIGELTSLQELMLDMNKITILPQSFENLKYGSFSLSDNPLKSKAKKLLKKMRKRRK